MSRTSLIPRLALFAGVAVALPACLNHPLKPVELEKAQEDKQTVDLQVNKDVDILFVIDNSGSMGEEQAKLSANFEKFIGVLEKKDVDANYRIGVTTTDVGNKWCGGTPDAGKLKLSSCLGRLGDFVFENTDVAAEACSDICNTDVVATLPTATHVSNGAEESRPWLERIDGAKNIADDISMVQAFQCVGPQGISGCGFEYHLESQYLALARAATSDEKSYGFVRPNAILAIVHVTDEVDCSNNNKWSSIFDATSKGGNQVFWSNQTLTYPTSATCWNAGVECSGDGDFYDDCVATDKDVEGNVTASSDKAVLHPLARYIDQVQGLQTSKQALNASQEVIVGLIGGVLDDGDVVYPSSFPLVPKFLELFGTGPGCSSGSGESLQTAVPPVRLREFTEAFGGAMFSVCNDDYSEALEAVADKIKDQIHPACYTECVEDTDPATADVVDPECSVTQTLPGAEQSDSIPQCARDADGSYSWADDNFVQPDDASNVCFSMLIDADGNATPNDENDDMSVDCVEAGNNLEFKITRRPGFAADGGTQISAKCSLSPNTELDCGS